MRMEIILFATVLALAGCAGRTPEPVLVVQPFDSKKTCDDLMAEINANNDRVTQLAREKDMRIVQNTAAGVGGVFIPVLWFALDLKGAAGVELTAMKHRQERLMRLMDKRNCGVSKDESTVAPTP